MALHLFFYDCIVVQYIFCRKLEAAGKMTSIQYYWPRKTTPARFDRCRYYFYAIFSRDLTRGRWCSVRRGRRRRRCRSISSSGRIYGRWPGRS